MEKRKQYAIGQHDLCCEHLSIGNSHEDHCDTLFEAVLALQDKAEQSDKRAFDLQQLAGELITALRLNAVHSGYDDSTIDHYMKPWIDRFSELKRNRK